MLLYYLHGVFLSRNQNIRNGTCDVSKWCWCYLCGTNDRYRDDCMNDRDPNFKRYWNYSLTVTTSVKNLSVAKTFKVLPHLLGTIIICIL